jgi:hypothetical protein
MEIYLWCIFLKINHLFIEVIFEESCFELEKLVIEMKHTCTY